MVESQLYSEDTLILEEISNGLSVLDAEDYNPEEDPAVCITMILNGEVTREDVIYTIGRIIRAVHCFEGLVQP